MNEKLAELINVLGVQYSIGNNLNIILMRANLDTLIRLADEFEELNYELFSLQIDQIIPDDKPLEGYMVVRKKK